MAGKRSGLEEKEKEEKEQGFPLMARASHWIFLGAYRCSFRGQFMHVNPGMHTLCGSRQLCSLLQSLNSFLFYIIYSMVLVPHLLAM